MNRLFIQDSNERQSQGEGKEDTYITLGSRPRSKRATQDQGRRGETSKRCSEGGEERHGNRN